MGNRSSHEKPVEVIQPKQELNQDPLQQLQNAATAAATAQELVEDLFGGKGKLSMSKVIKIGQKYLPKFINGGNAQTSSFGRRRRRVSRRRNSSKTKRRHSKKKKTFKKLSNKPSRKTRRSRRS